MPYTVKDFQREYVLEHIHKIPADERLKGINSKNLSELIKKRFSKKEQKEILKMIQGL